MYHVCDTRKLDIEYTCKYKIVSVCVEQGVTLYQRILRDYFLVSGIIVLFRVQRLVIILL